MIDLVSGVPLYACCRIPSVAPQRIGGTPHSSQCSHVEHRPTHLYILADASGLGGAASQGRARPLGTFRQARGKGAMLKSAAQSTTEQKLIAGLAKKRSFRGETRHSSLCTTMRGKNARGAR
jgi:hypothetical protein